MVLITERTSAGMTTVAWSTGTSRVLKQQWSTTRTRTGVRATRWRVSTTGPIGYWIAVPRVAPSQVHAAVRSRAPPLAGCTFFGSQRDSD